MKDKLDEFDRIEKMRNYVDMMKEKIDDMGLPEKEWEILNQFLIQFEAMLDDRECVFRIIELARPSVARMTSIVGTAEDEQILAVIDKILAKR